MKLRNKKTGEIRNIVIVGDNFLIEAKDYPNDTTIVIKSLAELNEDWEDYEDDCLSKIIEWINKGLEDEILPIEANDFVEKLEAWKRLKEAKIDSKVTEEYDTTIETTHANISISFNSYPLIGKDLVLLFGGKDGKA